VPAIPAGAIGRPRTGEETMAVITGTQWHDGGLLLPWPFDGFLLAGLIGRDDEDDFIFGWTGYDSLAGLGGNDHLDGGADPDNMAGGAGNDTYVVENVNDVVDEADDHLFLGDGTLQNDPNDKVRSYLEAFTLPFNVEILELVEGSAARVGLGNELGNIITGNSNNNVILGFDGNDELEGGDGNDTLNGEDDDDILRGNAHNDTLFGGAGDDELFGGSHGDTLEGGADDDLLDGGTGGDTMRGETGDDEYFIDNTADQVFEDVDAGNDTVFSTISFELRANFEHLTLLSTATAINGVGNSRNNDITGNDNNNTLEGRDGFDTIDGGAGADIMRGGRDSDTYFVDNVGDRVEELAEEGVDDTVYSSVDFDLAGTAVENLTLQAGALEGRGNALDNTLIANNAGNDLYGFFGEDTLKGGGGDDELRGGTQNDILKGGGGADQLRGEAGDDQMRGDAGNDSYFVDSLGDVVFEDGPAGDIDSVSTTINLAVLPANVERLFLQLPALNGTGNDLDNLIVGNALNNTLDGGAGTDEMIGGIGDDTYLVDDADDVVTEVAGQGQGLLDTVRTTVSYQLAAGTNVEQLAAADALATTAMNLTGNEIGNTIRGNDGANVIDGGGGADMLIGRAGQDTLTGGAAADIFKFNTVADSSLKLPDQIVDFVSIRFSKVSDTIDLSAIDSNVTLPGEQEFLFIGNNNNFFIDPNDPRGQVRCNGGFVEGDVNKDLIPDFRIQVFQQDNQLVTADFIL
jgi:Ca2+-binding RTX toxin-like protein